MQILRTSTGWLLLGLMGLAVPSHAQVDAPSPLWRFGLMDTLLSGALPLLAVGLLAVAWRVVGKSALTDRHLVSPRQYGWKPLLSALGVLVIGLIFTAFKVQSISQEMHTDAWWRFQQQVERLESDIQSQFDSVLGPLRSVRGALVSSDELTPREMAALLTAQGIGADFVGVHGVGLLDFVYRKNIKTGTASEWMVVRHMEPLDRNSAWIGMDLGTNPVVRAAAERARREGVPVLAQSAGNLGNKNQQPDFIFLLPIYAQPKVPESSVQRLAQFKGWAFASLNLTALLNQAKTNAQGLSNFQLFLGADSDARHLLFDTSAAQVPQRGPMFATAHPMLVGGQVFQLQATTTADFERGFDLQAPERVAFNGSALSVLLSAVLWLLLVSRANALVMAKGMTSELHRLALVVQHTSNAVVITDLQQKITWVNEGFTRITGFSAEEVMGRVPGHILQCEKTDPAVVRAISLDLKAARGGRYQLLNRHKDGHDYWIDIDIQPMRADSGEITGYLAVENDITAEVNTKRALVLEKERADNVLSGTNVGTWQSNLQTHEYLFSDRWAEMMGFSRSEVLPRSDVFFDQRVHPDDRTRSRNAMVQCLKGVTDVCSVEVRVAHKDGHWMWVLSRTTVMSRTTEGRVAWIGGVHTDITETKHLENSLRDMESFLDRAGRLTGLGIWAWDLKTQVLTWSDQTCLIHGLEAGHQPTLEEALSYFHPDEHAAVKTAIARAVEGGIGWDITTRFVNAQGRALWVRFSGEPEFDDSGAVRLVGAFQDVTRDKETQLRIERSESILRGSIDAVNEAYVLYDPDDKLVFCNEKYREMYSESADLIVPGATFESIIRGGAERGQYAEAQGRVEEWVRERLTAHRSSNTISEQRLNNGRWVRVVERRMDDGHIAGFRVDITELKLAIEAAQASSARLVETSRTLQAVLDSAVDVGIIAMGLDRQVSVFNSGAQRLLGYDANEVVGKSKAGKFFEPSQLQAISESLELVLGREPSVDEVFFEVGQNYRNAHWTIVRKDGTSFTSAVVLSPLLGTQGELSGFLAIFQDISKQMEYEASLRQAMLMAEQSSIAKSQFLANMSHEIRTPMNAILGMLQLLNNTALSAQQKDYTSKTQGAARSLLGLLNDILDFSKVEAGKMQLDPEPFVVNELLADLSVILSANLGGKNVDLLFDVDPALPKRLVGDELRIKQILINLGGNAVKFTEHGQVVVGWQLVSKAGDMARVRVTVRDSGIGIAPENQARIFEAFTQAEASTTRRFGGTGLGLVISTRLVRLMGSELELQSQAGQGSTFSFELDLPIALEVLVDVNLPLPPNSPAISIGNCVLLVDDNPVALATGASQMRTLGWNVEQASSGAKAVDIVNQRLQQGLPDFEALFVDWQMPEMDGWQTLREVRRLYADRAGPALILMSGQSQSALAGRTDREQELLQGFMVKPLTSTMFLEALAQARQRMFALGEGPSASVVAPVHASASLGGMRLLVVEDNLINQQVAQELLQSEGALVTLACDGREGVDAVLEADPPFDAVLMDLQMPVMDGLSATRMLRSHARLAALPIVAMTANAMASDKEECLAAGMTDHVGKPFDLQNLVNTLLRHTAWRAGGDVASSPPQAALPTAWHSDVDVQGALQRMGGNKSLLQRSMLAFIQDARALPERMQGWGAEMADPTSAQRDIHGFKGLAGTMGIALLAQAAYAVEQSIRQESWANLPPARDALCQAIAQWVPKMQDVADRLLPASTTVSLAANPSTPLPAEWLDQFKALHGALQASDMGAMEMHAELRCVPVAALETAMAPLDAAMADLDFDQAAVECEKILQQIAAV